MNSKPEAILLLNPVTNYLSIDVYCCVVKKTGFDNEADFLKSLNQSYSSFSEAVNLVAIGEIENLGRRIADTKNRKTWPAFSGVAKAKEELKGHNLYLYDMSEKKYKWIKL